LLTYIVRQPIPKLKDEPDNGIRWSDNFKYFIECWYVLTSSPCLIRTVSVGNIEANWLRTEVNKHIVSRKSPHAVHRPGACSNTLG
jgi:hypothetical protein